MDEREAARRSRAAALVRSYHLQYDGKIVGLCVDDDETIFTEDERGFWIRGWMLVAMEEMLHHIQMNGSHGDAFYVEKGEQEHMVGKKGHFIGTFIRCWIQIPDDSGTAEYVTD